MNRKWNKLSEVVSKDDVAIETKIDDEHGCRNMAILKPIGRLWYFLDGSMYVYYVPTHWRELEPSEANTI